MSEASGGAPGQGGREVLIGLPIRSIYDLSLARHHLKSMLETQVASTLFLTGDAVRTLEFVLSFLDSLNSTVQMVESTRRKRHAPSHKPEKDGHKSGT